MNKRSALFKIYLFNIKKLFFLLVIVFTTGLVSKGQNPDAAQFPSKVSPPSPEAARFIQYGQYQVGNAGRPEISIPIFNIESSGLTLPISLNYEGTGCIPDDLPSWVGSGWLLNTGGVITRVVMGLPDESGFGFLNTPQYTIAQLSTGDDTYKDYMYKSAINMADTEPDMYYYSFNGHSGQFTYDQSKNIYQIPQTALVITRVGDHFQIIDETGKTYIFGGNEFSDSYTDLGGPAQTNCVTSWWLTSVQNAEKTDNITLEYQLDNRELEIKMNYAAAYGESGIVGGTDPKGGPGSWSQTGKILDLYQSELHREWVPQRVSRITFKNGKVEFNRIADRLDGGGSRLDNIVIFNKTNASYNKLKTIKFVTDNFYYGGEVNSTIFYANLTGRYRLKLNRLEEYDAQDNLVNKHVFDYNTAVAPPFRGTLAQDYWGYYNGADNNNGLHTLLPALTTYDLQQNFGGAVREPNEEAMKAGVLNSITYPTGGTTTFTWEAHRYAFSGSASVPKYIYNSAYGNNSLNDPHPSIISTFVQDVTVSAVLLIDISMFPMNPPPYSDPVLQNQVEDNPPRVYLKDLTTGQVIYTEMNLSPSTAVFHSVAVNLIKGDTYEMGSFCFKNSVSAHANMTLTYNTTTDVADIRIAGGLRLAGIVNHGDNILQSTSEVYKYGRNESGYGGSLSSGANTLYNFSFNRGYKFDDAALGKPSCFGFSTTRVLYSSSSVYGLGLSSGSSVIYPVITKYNVSGTTNTGKTINYYDESSEYAAFPMPYGAERPFYPVSSRWMTGKLLSTEEYKNTGSDYKLIKQITNTYDVIRSLPENDMVKIGWNMDMSHANCFDFRNFYLVNIPMQSGNYKLISTVTKQFEDTGTIETKQAYTYDNVYYDFPVTETVTNSDEKVLKTWNKYPFNKNLISGLSTPASAAIDKMIQNNIVSAVIEKEKYQDDVLTVRARTDYKIWDNISPDMIKPSGIQIQYASNPMEQRFFYHQYDNTGNLTEQSAAAAPHTAYQWGYNQQYPVAEVKNAQGNDIWYDSFEEGNGNSAAGDSKSGHYSYSGAYSKGLSGLDNGTYTLSYWSKSGGTWTFVVNNSITVAGSYAISLPSGQYDDIRFYPTGSLMTTYTYDPQVGQTSSTDPKGEVTYYEYDNYQRLINTRDKDNNIIRHTNYHFKGQ